MSTFDVAIIGGGVIGASIGFELAADRLRVIVLDQQQPGQEASWAAAGMLSPGPHSPKDIPLVPLGRESLGLYPEFVASIEKAAGKSAPRTSIGFAREGAIHIFNAPEGEPERDRMVSEYLNLGLAAQPISLDTAREWEPLLGPAARAAAWLPDEATVEPRPLMESLLAAAQYCGVEIRSDCRVTGLLNEHGRCTGVVVNGEEILAGHLVLAAGCFSSQLGGAGELIARCVPIRPVRGQMLALRSKGVTLRHVLRSEQGYLVPRSNGLIVAGSTLEDAGFEKRVTPEGRRQILDAAIGLAPSLAEAEIVEEWSGLRPGTPDDLPILGPTDMEGLLIATGHYRNGILLAPITAKLVHDWITRGRTNFDATAFSPMRFSRPESHAERAMRRVT